MSDYCRDWEDGALWDGEHDEWVLCEGHGQYERLGIDGRVVEVVPFNTANPPVDFEVIAP